MTYTEIHSIKKKADYSDYLSHDFYDKLTPRRDDDFTRYIAYFKGLNKLFNKILKGKHGMAYMGRGKKETGDTKGLYITPLFGDEALSYIKWKSLVEKNIKNKNLDMLLSLTYPPTFHVITSSPTSRYGDIFENSPSTAYIKSIYRDSPKLTKILALAAKHRQLEQDVQNALDALYDVEEPFFIESDRLLTAQLKALQGIERRRLKAYDKWYDAKESGKDKTLIDRLYKKYEELVTECLRQLRPFNIKGEDIASRQLKATKNHHKKLKDLERRLSRLYGEHI